MRRRAIWLVVLVLSAPEPARATDPPLPRPAQEPELPPPRMLPEAELAHAAHGPSAWPADLAAAL